MVAGLLLAGAAGAQTATLDEAEQLLAAGKAAEAVAAYEKILEADPESADAQLGLARAIEATGDQGRAELEYGTVFGLEDVADDLATQLYIYDQVAEDAAEGRRFRPFYYAETGVGTYRENTSSGTAVFGGAGDYDTFLPIRVGMGWNSTLSERHQFNGLLDYRFRYYDETARRNDSDLRWNFNLTRPIDDDRLRFGTRGRVSYRGDGDYRNDWGFFVDYRLGITERDQFTIGGEVRERRYPSGPLRARTRDIAEFTGTWDHALANGDTSFSLGGTLGQEWATQERPDGNASFWGATGGIDHAFTDAIDAFFWWSYVNESFDDERPVITAPGFATTRNDDLWNFGAGLTWAFAPGWTLRPEIEYNWEDSNMPEWAYSSTEAWVTVRYSF